MLSSHMFKCLLIFPSLTRLTKKLACELLNFFQNFTVLTRFEVYALRLVTVYQLKNYFLYFVRLVIVLQ